MDNYNNMYPNNQISTAEKNSDVIEHRFQETTPSIYQYGTKSTIAQCIATFVNGLSFISLGMMYTMPTVVIEDLQNAKNGLSLKGEEASWYASLLPMFQPFGCFLGGFLQNYIGRKYGTLLMNISTIITWIILYEAINIEMLYASSILMGISIGFSEAPGLTYVGEITTPNVRGILVSYNNFNVTIGIMLMFLLTSFINWRIASLFCAGFAVFSILLFLFVPDSPVWLINKGRNTEAIKALRWLRGWVAERNVIPEFEEVRQFIIRSYSNYPINQQISGWNSSSEQRFKINYLFEKATLRPFCLLFGYTLFALSASIQGARNYYLTIFNSLTLPVESKWLAFSFSVALVVGNLICVVAVKITGKRTLSLISMFSTSSSTLLLGLYIIFQSELNQPWIFVVLFICMGLTQTIGISAIPWVLLGEIYPVKTRSVAAGLTAAAFYVSYSIYIRTYYYLELMLSTQGAFILYGIIGFVGFFYLWVFMPETEGKTMAEIEELFADGARRSCAHFRTRK